MDIKNDYINLRIDFSGADNSHQVMLENDMLYMTQDRRDADFFIAQLRVWAKRTHSGRYGEAK